MRNRPNDSEHPDDPVILDKQTVNNSLTGRATKTKGITLVSYYCHQRDRRPKVLNDWLVSLQAKIREFLTDDVEKNWIRITPNRDIHATLLGLERLLECSSESVKVAGSVQHIQSLRA